MLTLFWEFRVERPSKIDDFWGGHCPAIFRENDLKFRAEADGGCADDLVCNKIGARPGFREPGV